MTILTQKIIKVLHQAWHEIFRYIFSHIQIPIANSLLNRLIVYMYGQFCFILEDFFFKCFHLKVETFKKQWRPLKKQDPFEGRLVCWTQLLTGTPTKLSKYNTNFSCPFCTAPSNTFAQAKKKVRQAMQASFVNVCLPKQVSALASPSSVKTFFA